MVVVDYGYVVESGQFEPIIAVKQQIPLCWDSIENIMPVFIAEKTVVCIV